MDKEKLSVEEVIENVSKDKMNLFNKLAHSYVAIRQLVDFMQVLEKNEKDYKDEINIRICKETKLHPSDILSHYIVLEAFNFYETLRCLKKTDTSIPDNPPYFNKLKKVRDKVIAHKDNRGEFHLAEDVLKLLKELNEEASTEKIIKDVFQTFNLVNTKTNPVR